MASESMNGEFSDQIPTLPSSVPHNLPGEKQSPQDACNEEAQDPFHTDKPDARNSLLDNVKPDDCTSIPKEANESSQEPYPYVSFGDNGTTASLNSYGDLIQICQSHESSRSGFFCVDPPWTPEPFFVQNRAERLMDLRSREQECIFASSMGQKDMPERSSEIKLEFIHNRWPLFTAEYEHITLRTLHVAFQNIIFQQYQWSTTADVIEYSSGVDLSLPMNMLIPDLDFMDPSYRFNEDSQDENYTRHLCKSEYAVILKHAQLSQDKTGHQGVENSDSIALAVSMFVNGKAQQLVLEGNGSGSTISIKRREEEFLVESTKSLQMTVAYKILLRKEEWNSSDSPITMDNLSEMHRMLKETSFTRLEWSSDTHMDFIMRRNLEHILSVCSIPMPHVCQADCQTSCSKQEAIALTCGDMSGHRIVTSASFFAFQFLLSMYEHLDKTKARADSEVSSSKSDKEKEVAHELNYLEDLRSRIKKVCKGHTLWLIEAEKDRNGFRANYWVTGKAISKEHLSLAVSAKSLTDTPFQLIKLADFMETFKLGKDDPFLAKLRGQLRDLVKPWIQEVDQANKRGFYAMCRPKTDDTTVKEFRLDEHVWIWRTLLSVKDFGLRNEPEKHRHPPNRRSKTASTSLSISQEMKLNFDYSPAEFQKHVLRRFTTENPVSKQRMLAVARSLSESRFYLHSRDTALLYQKNSKFLSKYDALWEATMSVQRFHEEHEDSRWGNPLRYALAIMINEKINHEDVRQREDPSQAAKDILLQSSSANGLFPGALHPVTKEPELFQDEMWRDAYWHRTFEVPYFLWQCRDSKLSRSGSSNVPVPVPKDLPANSQALDLYSTQMEMKRWIPFNNVIVQQSIVELSDEWLYELPSLFHPALGEVCHFLEEDETDTFKGVIINVPKANRNKRNEDLLRCIKPLGNAEIYVELKKERTAQSSKKRLIWISNPTTDTKNICCSTSTETEQELRDSFFDRHENKSKYFSDEVTASANLWTTELHLSSYRLLGSGKNREGTGMKFLGVKDLFIGKSGAGFRFVGDFFDRYWTCHVLETDLNNSMTCPDDLKGILEPKILESTGDQYNKRPWKQRKVLELLLLDRMLNEITKRYQEMIKETGNQLQCLLPHASKRKDKAERNIVSISNELFTMQMDNSAYLSFRKILRSFQYSLQVMEEDLNEILEKINLWMSRKTDRKPEEPRWTRNDERRYRAAITKLTSSNAHSIRELRDHLATLKSLRTSLSSGLESTRDDLNYLNAENIRYFTYLTAVFLPLGFATGIWSMAESSPRSESLKGMAITAVVTLLLTIIALVYVQKFKKRLVQYTSHRFPTKHIEEQSKSSLSVDSASSPIPHHTGTASSAGYTRVLLQNQPKREWGISATKEDKT